MWMMGYNDGGDLYMSDSINAAGRKLRPLVPRPLTAATSGVGAATISTPPCLNRIHGADHLFINNGSMSEQNKREFNPEQVVVSSRWNPTPEQLRALEELYRRGTRTPTADQIQHITAQLRRYGKIEGKNVFYWFQNHKARERQKRRREMESDDHTNRDVEILERKETGASRTVFGVDQQTKNWIPPINSSTLPEESTVCMQKAAKGGAGGSELAECKSSEHHQWMKMDERVGNGGGGGRELQFIRRNDTWQAMQLSCPATTHHINTPKPPMDPKHQLFNYKSGNSNINSPHLTPFLISSTPPPPPPPEIYNIPSDDGEEEEDADHHHPHHHHDHFRHHHHFIINNRFMNVDRDEDDDDEDDENAQTLELFPLRSGDFGHEKDSEMSLGAINNGFNTPHQFFEFLPMKN